MTRRATVHGGLLAASGPRCVRGHGYGSNRLSPSGSWRNRGRTASCHLSSSRLHLLDGYRRIVPHKKAWVFWHGTVCINP